MASLRDQMRSLFPDVCSQEDVLSRTTEKDPFKKKLKQTKNRELLESLALRDFGTTDIPGPLRGEARRLAKELGCSPNAALPLAKKNLARKEESEGNLKKLGKSQKKTRKVRKIKKRPNRTMYTYGGKAVRSVISGGGGPGTGKRR